MNPSPRRIKTPRLLQLAALSGTLLVCLIGWVWADYDAICECCGRPYRGKGSLPLPKSKRTGPGAGTARIGFCQDCVGHDPCEHAEEEANAIRARHRAVGQALMNLRTLGPATTGYAAQEKALLDEADRLQARWNDLVARCQIHGKLGDDGPAFRNKKSDPAEDRKKAASLAKEYDRMASTLDQMANETDLQAGLGEAIWAATGELLPGFVQAYADIADDYTFGIRQGHQDLADGYRALADQYRDAGKKAADESAMPDPGKKPRPESVKLSEIRPVEAEPRKLKTLKAETKTQKQLLEIRDDLEKARAHQDALRQSIERFYKTKKAPGFEYRVISHAGRMPYHAERMTIHLERAAMKLHGIELARRNALDVVLTKTDGKTRTEQWEKTRARIREKGLSEAMMTVLTKANVPAEKIAKLKDRLVGMDAAQLESALVAQKTRLDMNEAARMALEKDRSKQSWAELPGMRGLRDQQHFTSLLFHRHMASGSEVGK